MSEMMEGNGPGQNSTIRTEPGFHFRDNNNINSYHVHNGYLAANQGFNESPSVHPYGFQHSHDVSHTTNSIRGHDQLQQYYPLLQGYTVQEAEQSSDSFFQNDMQNFRTYSQQYHPLGSYPPSNYAYPVPSYSHQDDEQWEEESTYDMATNQQNLTGNNMLVSASQPAQAATSQSDHVYTNEPYAKLIYIALRSAPGHKMVLKDIYKWFERFTDKAQSGSKGWQNSIRHNLSMNIAFQKAETEESSDGKRNYVWVLSREALRKGCVESTTRFRKPLKKIPVPQPSYRVSKASTTPIKRSASPLPHLLLPFNQVWNNNLIGVQQKYDSEEPEVLQAQDSIWQYQLPQELPPTAFRLPSYQSLPNHNLPIIHSSNGYEPITGGFSHFDEGTPASHLQQTLKYEDGDMVRPFGSTAVKRDSSTPSMTATTYSFGYQELTDEEQYQANRSLDLQLDILDSGEQAYSRSRISS